MEFTLQKEEIQRTIIRFSVSGGLCGSIEKGKFIKKMGRKLEEYTRKYLPAAGSHVFIAPACFEHLYVFEVQCLPRDTDMVLKWLKRKAMSMGMVLTMET